MAENEASKSEARTGIDFLALELEIDREIDALFVPAAKMAQGTVEESKIAGEAHNVSESRQGASPDFDALHSEIDKEIDNLFVPAGKPDWNEKPVQIENEEQPKMLQGSSPATDEQGLQGARKARGPSWESAGGGSLRAKYDETPPDITFDSQRYHFHELSKLIEIFNAAYLSLDWEFSPENVRKFLTALNQLEPFASRSADAGSVLRILDTILNRLLDRPHAINSRLVQLIRDSQGLLAHLLLMEGETGPHEKQRLKYLIGGFQELRQKALAAKAEATRPKTGETAQPPAPCDKPQLPPEAQPARISPETDKDSLQELPDLMDKTWRSLSENLEIIDTEIARLRQIETILGKTPALVPISRRLNGIASALEGQVDLVRDKRGELTERISRIKKPETAWPAGKINAQEPEGGEPVGQTAEECQKASTQVLPEILHLIASDGQCLALPASCVLRVARSSERKGLKILKRGYATLADFRPSFRGIKTGVLGEWTKLPGKELRYYKFEPVTLDSFNRAETGGQMAVLASDGQKHAIIFAERVDFTADVEIDTGSPAEKAPEAVETLSLLLAPVFDPCSPPSPPERLSSTSSKTDRCCRR
ncbi:MAG: hypothetical protein ABSG91_00770 [Syntrophobacteraceae bacterium]|jgi:hypothetical protein